MTNELGVLSLFLEEYVKAKEELNGVDNMMNDIFVTDKTSIHVFEGDELVGIYTKETGVPKIHIEELLEERDVFTRKYGLAGAEFNRLYDYKQEKLKSIEELNGADTDGDIRIPKVYSHKPNDNEARFKKITKEMVDLYSRKNTDYGGSFDESLDEDGLLVAKIRMKDKLNRFSQLIDNDGLVEDESLRDTLIDLANYSVMTIMWLDDEKD